MLMFPWLDLASSGGAVSQLAGGKAVSPSVSPSVTRRSDAGRRRGEAEGICAPVPRSRVGESCDGARGTSEFSPTTFAGERKSGCRGPFCNSIMITRESENKQIEKEDNKKEEE